MLEMINIYNDGSYLDELSLFGPEKKLDSMSRFDPSVFRPRLRYFSNKLDQKRLRGRTINSIKIYVGEMLAVLLQNSDQNREKVGQADGVDILLKVRFVCFVWSTLH